MIGEGFCRFEESPFLEMEKPTMLNLQLMGAGVGVWSADPAIRPIVECSVGKSPGRKALSLGSDGRQDFWSQQKQAHIDYRAHLKSTR